MHTWTDIEALANDGHGDFYARYSGRCMFGTHCPGIVTSAPLELIIAARRRGVSGEKQDNMGLDFIVYWPGIAAPTEAPSTED